MNYRNSSYMMFFKDFSENTAELLLYFQKPYLPIQSLFLDEGCQDRLIHFEEEIYLRLIFKVLRKVLNADSNKLLAGFTADEEVFLFNWHEEYYHIKGGKLWTFRTSVNFSDGRSEALLLFVCELAVSMVNTMKRHFSRK